MELNLSKQTEAWLAAQVAAGSFASAEEAIDTVIADLCLDIENDDMMWAKPLVDEALAAVERGEVVSLEEHEREVEAHMESLRLRFPP
jgi:antitoxin ParD1/3/4